MKRKRWREVLIVVVAVAVVVEARGRGRGRGRGSHRQAGSEASRKKVLLTKRKMGKGQSVERRKASQQLCRPGPFWERAAFLGRFSHRQVKRRKKSQPC